MERPNHAMLPAVEVTDDLGTFTRYNRVCNFLHCGVALTSRNRLDRYLMCKPCGLIKDALRHSSKPRTTADIASAAAKKTDPRRAEAHALLDAFLKHPTNDALKQQLHSKLVDAELVARFRFL